MRGPTCPGPTYTAADGALVRAWALMAAGIRGTAGRVQRALRHHATAVRARADKPTLLDAQRAYVERSEDRGKTWKRQAIAELDTYVSGSSPWSMTQLPDGTVLRAFMVRKDSKCAGRVMVAITRDGRKADLVDVMGDPENKLPFTEETLVYTTSKGAVWMLTRVHGTGAPIWQAVSQDGGRTWTARPTEIDARSTPPSGLVKLKEDGWWMV